MPATSLAILLLVLFLSACSEAPRPRGAAEKPGLAPEGMSAPEYHSPVKYWAARHGDLMRGGVDFGLGECMLCHEAGKSCDGCHRYVGAPAVSVPRERGPGR